MQYASLPRVLWVFLSLCVLLCCFPACTPVKPGVIKIGLIAPFEGDKRYLGYDAIYAARLAVREINRAGGINGIPVELVAYDDRASSDMAADAVRNLAADPQVVAVVGHYYEISSSVKALYTQYELPVFMINASASNVTQQKKYHFYIAPDWDSVQSASSTLDVQSTLVDYTALSDGIVSADAAQEFCAVTPYPFPLDVPGTEAWIADYIAVGPHVPAPGMMALVTYDATKAIAHTLGEYSANTRQEAASALLKLDYTGYLGRVSWNEAHHWEDASLYFYCWHDEQLTLQRQLTAGE